MARSKKAPSERILSFTQLAIGTEPKYPEGSVTNENWRSVLINGLNWHARESKTESSKEWVMKEFTNPTYRKIPDYTFGNLGFVLRMISRGFPRKYVEQSIQNKINFLNTWVDPEETSQTKPKDSSKKEDVLLNQVKESIDLFVDGFLSNKKVDLNVDITVLSKSQQSSVKAYLERNLNTFEFAYREKNQDGEDLYNITSQQCRAIAYRFREILNTLNTSTAVRVRKTRTPKAKPISKIVERVKYAQAYNEFKGLQPEKIVGAKMMLLFNIKRRQATIVTSTTEGFSVKGTTLANVEKSVSKTIRRPEVQLKLLVDSAKTQIEKTFEKINSKEYTPSNRMSEDILILKVWG